MSIRKVSVFLHATFHTQDRCAQAEKRNKVQKLKVLKRELKHIIRKLTDWKDFVFANAFLPT